jgi:hypothetical protein
MADVREALSDDETTFRISSRTNARDAQERDATELEALGSRLRSACPRNRIEEMEPILGLFATLVSLSTGPPVPGFRGGFGKEGASQLVATHRNRNAK